MGADSLVTLAAILLIGLLAILLCREVACWYLKTSNVLGVLVEIRNILKELTIRDE